MCDVVISRYNENIDWIDRFPVSNSIFYLYNKGNDDIEQSTWKEPYHYLEKFSNQYKKFGIWKQPLRTRPANLIKIQLPNMGREAHTYLYHIVNQYKELDPNRITVFTQGRFHDHLGGIENFISMTNEAREKGFCESRARYHNIPMSDQPLPSFRLLEWPKNNILERNKNDEPFGSWFVRLLEKEVPELSQYKWIPGAIFAVKNEVILRKPLSFYETLLHEFHTSSSQPEVAHFFERAWFYIFK